MICRACGGSTAPVFEMDPMPLAAAFAPTREDALAAECYPLTWRECSRCGLVNVDPDIPDAILYAQYAYSASNVPALVRHHAEFARFLTTRFPGKAGIRHLEIGCNDGVLLRQLPANWERVGVDPSDVAAGAAGDWGLVPLPFTSRLARSLGRFHLVTSSNAFAHFSGIGDALDGVAAVLKAGGEFWVEVHDLDATLALGQWDTIYHEHKVEWSEDALIVAAGLHGLMHIGTERLPLHGGLLRLGFRKANRAYTVPTPAPRDFAALRASYAVREAPRLPSGSVAYGAAARASVYLNQVKPNVGAVIDGSPLRAGRYVPGVGLPILSPWEFDRANPPAALITAWNHADDIKARHPEFTDWVTAW
jgi:methylation protein EvaC